MAIIGINLSTNQFNSPDHVVKEYFDQLLTPFEIHRIPFGDREIRYVETGLQNNDAPIFIFIHGAPGSWDAFKKFLADYELRDMARLISVDRLGYGGSGLGHSETDIAIQAEAIATVLNQYDSTQVIVTSHSYGGPISGKLTVEHPDMIDGTIMCAPLNDPDNEPMKWYSLLANTKLSRALMPAFIDMATDEKMSHAESLEAIRHDWKLINSPIVHVHGLEDNIAPSKVNLEFSKNNIPPEYLETIEIDDCNHYVIWDRGAQIKQIIINLHNSIN